MRGRSRDVDEVQGEDRCWWKERVSGHQGAFGLEVVDDFGPGREYPAGGGNLHCWISFDVPNPIGPAVVRRDDEDAVLKPLTRQEDLSRETGPPSAGCEEDPAGSPYEVTAKEPHEEGLQAAREARDEVEPSDERFGHQKSMRHLRSVLQRGASGS